MPTHFDRSNHIFRSSDLIRIVDQAFTFFVNSPMLPLPPSNSFEGAGVYALYYVGDFEAYSAIADSNRNGFDKPIYAGNEPLPSSLILFSDIGSFPSIEAVTVTIFCGGAAF